MINIVDKTKCCGCTACANICPTGCISMIEDNEGFLYPKANKEKCIHCDACDRVCPVLNSHKQITFDQAAYLVQNKDAEILKESTSGGAFSEIARYIIRHDGIVFGVEMTEELFVKHIAIEQEEDIAKFRNSKYVQSYLGDIFKQVKVQLATGRLVLFSGTPCQTEGLLHFLGKKPGNLVICDIVCHGVPSPGIWKKYVSYISDKYGHIASVRFRDKGLGYQYSTMTLETDKGEIRAGLESDPWLRMFFSGMSTRPSCSACKFKNPYRKSDFTIWDCFPTYRLAPEFNENAGTTRVLIQTHEGQQIFNAIDENFICKQVTVADLVAGVYEMQLSHPMNSRRNEFYADYEVMDIGDLLERYYPRTSKVKAKKIIRIELNKYGLDRQLKHLLRKG